MCWAHEKDKLAMIFTLLFRLTSETRRGILRSTTLASTGTWILSRLSSSTTQTRVSHVGTRLTVGVQVHARWNTNGKKRITVMLALACVNSLYRLVVGLYNILSSGLDQIVQNCCTFSPRRVCPPETTVGDDLYIVVHSSSPEPIAHNANRLPL